MRKKIKWQIIGRLSLFLAFIIPAYSDCIFTITNYANVPLVAKAGFFNGASEQIIVNNASSKSIKVKDPETCTSASPSGLGVAYIKLISGKSSGGFVYYPPEQMIRATGTSSLNANNTFGQNPDGTQLILNNNYKPLLDKFAVTIEQASRNLSKPASMN